MSKDMSDAFDAIRDFFSREGIFTCEPCIKDTGSFEVRVKHHLDLPAKPEVLTKLEQAIGKPLTPSHRQFLSMWNGASLFSQARVGKKEAGGGRLRRLFGWLVGITRQEVGVRLYSAGKLPSEHREVIRLYEDTLKELLDDSDPEVVNGAKDDLENWLPGLVVIGEELGSGNYLALDYCQRTDPDEHPVVHLDHELMAMGSEGQGVIANSVEDLLIKMKDTPAEFLNDTLSCITRYRDGHSDEQWVPRQYALRMSKGGQNKPGRGG